MIRKLTIAYRGTDYSGWQRQINAVTVQQVVEDALCDLTGLELSIVGASRTDAGVHARGQVAHVAGAESLGDRALVHGTNHRLPEDVRVLEATTVADGFHARKHAVGKLYSYRMVRVPVLSPLDAPFAVRVDPRIDVAAMKAACTHLQGEHDFSAFALAGGAHRSSRRHIFSAICEEFGPDVRFYISGNGFLRGMVRSLAGTLVEVGLGRRRVAEFASLLDGGLRAAAGPTAAARGLTLEAVHFADHPGTVGKAASRTVGARRRDPLW
ncbi:MAG: tRNA pseudouridine(38-40) synthase TruA [Acidobacteriota bacterium]|nr:tRNA pseudouridine(38-40) synthase TruA [Acidobacteriota bacterium]